MSTGLVKTGCKNIRQAVTCYCRLRPERKTFKHYNITEAISHQNQEETAFSLQVVDKCNSHNCLGMQRALRHV